MTRPASRIDSVLAALAAYWRAHPDLRLGQLVLNALRDPSGAVNKDHAWNAEDDVLVRGLAEMAALSNSSERIVLADDDFDAFSAAVMNPALPTEALRALFRRTPCPTCGTALPIIPPDRVIAYLERRGWIEMSDSADRPWAWFDLGEATIDVPLEAAWNDYPRRFLELLGVLRRIEGRAMVEIVEEMRGIARIAICTDEISCVSYR